MRRGKKALNWREHSRRKMWSHFFAKCRVSRIKPCFPIVCLTLQAYIMQPAVHYDRICNTIVSFACHLHTMVCSLYCALVWHHHYNDTQRHVLAIAMFLVQTRKVARPKVIENDATSGCVWSWPLTRSPIPKSIVWCANFHQNRFIRFQNIVLDGWTDNLTT